MGKRNASLASRAVIENCDKRFSFQCPRQWKELAPTNDVKIRHCGVCERNVFYCDTFEELEQFAKEGKCAAVDYGPEVVLGNLEVLD